MKNAFVHEQWRKGKQSEIEKMIRFSYVKDKSICWWGKNVTILILGINHLQKYLGTEYNSVMIIHPCNSFFVPAIYWSNFMGLYFHHHTSS